MSWCGDVWWAQENEAALAAALREELQNGSAAADKLRADLVSANGTIKALRQRVATTDDRVGGLSTQLEDVRRDLRSLIDSLGKVPARAPSSAPQAPPPPPSTAAADADAALSSASASSAADGQTAVVDVVIPPQSVLPSLTDLAVGSPHSTAPSTSQFPTVHGLEDAVADGHRMVLQITKNLTELHALLAAIPPNDTAVAADAASAGDKSECAKGDSGHPLLFVTHCIVVNAA